eukprot:CAMPEP_0197559814 /NCGR_PEP_ID=MMETSP1320-20131121/21932_1 /TAXON_ID=91990 /ORGANISM="Bolidomonas sp., Strain RCC2347" /LENGTH=554 /DNA_ID=CAMNT_0043121299 /DNA_START=225 /DNA_END=1886 /DNA_ORIENTATION=-
MDASLEEMFTAHYSTQTSAYFDWASFGSMDLSVDIFFHPLSLSERDTDGNCRSHPGLDFSGVAGFDADSYDVREFNVLMTEGCSGPCASGVGGIECTTMHSTEALESCDTASSTTLCQPTFVHEILHALGLGYHADMYECSQEEIDDFPQTTWRDCTNVEYGGRLDVLGSTSGEKISFGIASRLRYDLGWMDADDITVLEKDDAVDSWTETSVDVTLSALDKPGGNAAIVRFTAPVLETLGTIWLEYRGGYSFDSNVATDNPGILAFHYGKNLIDLAPSDDYTHVTLDVGASPFSDPASGLVLETISADGDTALVRVTFSPPPVCVPAAPSLNLPGYFGGYKVWLAKADDVSKYQPTEEGWGAVSENGWIAEYHSYWWTDEVDTYPLIMSYQLSARNNDGATCGDSTLSVRGASIPDGWRVDEGACQNVKGGQATTDVCFSVAIAPETPDGPVEILVEIFKEEDGMVSPELYRLWVCVGGFNPWFQSVANDRHPPWECVFGGNTEGTVPEPALNPRDDWTDSPTHAPTDAPTHAPSSGSDGGLLCAKDEDCPAH